MKKVIVLIICFSSVLFSFGQLKRLRVGYNENLNISQNYGKYTQIDKSKLYRGSRELNIVYDFAQKKGFNISAGFAYNRLSYFAKDVLTSYLQKTDYVPIGTNTEVTIFELIEPKDPLDYTAVANNFGLTFELDKRIERIEKLNLSYGFSTAVFLAEYFKQSYTDDLVRGYDKFFKGVRMVRSSVSLKNTFNPEGKITLSPKIELGANPYANWSQFRNYVWLGFGLEIGFQHKKKK